MRVKRKTKEEQLADEEELKNLRKTVTLEKGDTLALIIAAFTTLFPVFLLALGIFIGILWLLFLH